ncbi:hypothetical protein J5X84_04355 [Streptosporangiaceae bacterium NEAU-GS5]|nr:hypothetical protein [Streptosporangiaceae bacterium NEAU-GS5]
MDTQQIHNHGETIKKLGHWTTARSFEVRSRHGYTVLDLRSLRIPEGDIEIHVDLDRSALKLLLPDDARVDHWDLRWVGRGKVKDSLAPAGDGGRVVRVTGEIRHGEIRVNRGGVAVLTAIFSREFVAEARAAHREGRTPTVADPTNIA